MGKVTWRRTPFDWAILVFLLTAVLGVWVAYDRAQAGIKFVNIIAGVVIFYILASQRRQNIWRVAGMLGMLASVVAIYFLLTHDWQTWPTDIGLLTQLGQWWMQLRPNLLAPAIHPNIAGGLMVILLPFQVAFGIYGYRKRKHLVWGTTIILASVTLLGLLLTSSRAAWLSLLTSLALWFVWVMSDKFGSMIDWPRARAFFLLLILFLSAGIGFSFVVADGPLALAGNLPGANNTTSRLDLFAHTLDLIADYPFTGGGLAAFPGLFSQYIAITPFFQFNYGHNLWLDVALEQTLLGLLALMWMIGGSGLLLGRPIVSQGSAISIETERSRYQVLREQSRQDLNIFCWATVIGLLVMCLHGFVDDALYGGLGTPFLFVLPGMATAVSGKRESRWFFPSIPALKLGLILVVLAASAGIGARRNLTANWYANLGAVMMGQVELRDWPTDRWDDGRNVTALEPAKSLLHQALDHNPDNITAQYRLGLIAMLERDYGTAVNHLEVAQAGDSEHRGIQKSLGYSYVWVGKFEKAALMLADIGEAEKELGIYSGWWEKHERNDLAAKAAEMAELFDDDVNLGDERIIG